MASTPSGRRPLTTCAAQGLTTTAQYLALPLKQAPEWSYRLGANFSHDMGDRGVVSVGADYSAKDDHYNNLCASPGIRVQDYEFLNAQLRWENAAGNLLVALGGNNLTDTGSVQRRLRLWPFARLRGRLPLPAAHVVAVGPLRLLST